MFGFQLNIIVLSLAKQSRAAMTLFQFSGISHSLIFAQFTFYFFNVYFFTFKYKPPKSRDLIGLIQNLSPGTRASPGTWKVFSKYWMDGQMYKFFQTSSNGTDKSYTSSKRISIDSSHFYIRTWVLLFPLALGTKFNLRKLQFLWKLAQIQIGRVNIGILSQPQVKIFIPRTMG